MESFFAFCLLSANQSLPGPSNHFFLIPLTLIPPFISPQLALFQIQIHHLFPNGFLPSGLFCFQRTLIHLPSIPLYVQTFLFETLQNSI